VKYRRDLQIKLQQKYRLLYKTDANLYSRQVSYLVAFIRDTPALAAIAAHIERSRPDIDPQAWVAENFGWHNADWPDSELGRAKVAWHLLQQWAVDPNAAWNFGHNLDPSSSNMDEGARTATEAVVEPLVEYFQEQIGDSSDVLYLLEKYAHRVDWFEQEPLFAVYEANKSRGESIYDRDLRRFLFEQGIDYPFSQPRSASGKADVVAGVDSEDPLVCEIKLYDGVSYGKPYLAKGVQQAVAYANDYGKTTAYLVVVNLSDQQLDLPTKEPGAWPPRLDISGVTVFLVVVRAKPQPSASQRGALKAVKVTTDYLVHTD
jgi:hypothetical protein